MDVGNLRSTPLTPTAPAPAGGEETHTETTHEYNLTDRYEPSTEYHPPPPNLRKMLKLMQPEPADPNVYQRRDLREIYSALQGLR